jgi:hypothetical protein
MVIKLGGSNGAPYMRLISSTSQTATSILPIHAGRRRKFRRTAGASSRSAGSVRWWLARSSRAPC